MAVPGMPFSKTSNTLLCVGLFTLKLVGGGARAPAAGPLPDPWSPWQLAQFAENRAPPRLTSSCKSSGSDAGCRTGALRLYPPIMAIGTLGGVALAEGSLAIAVSEVPDVALDAIACRSKPECSRGRPRY